MSREKGREGTLERGGRDHIEEGNEQ